MSSVTRLRVLVVLASCAALPAMVLAQELPQGDSGSDRKAGTYLKIGLAHWQGDIFSRSSLTNWDVDLFGAEYDLTSLNLQIERYFGGSFLVSGFSIGYRKDALRYADSGHMFNASLFRDIGLKVGALKAGGGIEWGMPSLNFDRTEFDVHPDGTIRYRHTHPANNADVPFVGTKTDGAVYPFFELSFLERSSGVMLEFGIRVNIIGFDFDDYELLGADQVTHAFVRRKVPVPYLFANLGFRLF